MELIKVIPLIGFWVTICSFIEKLTNLWQVFKFEPGKHEPSMTLGKAFEPGTENDDTERFCKPTDVAVTSTGDFYVSDG